MTSMPASRRAAARASLVRVVTRSLSEVTRSADSARTAVDSARRFGSRARTSTVVRSARLLLS